jgi:hypothetical protein
MVGPFSTSYLAALCALLTAFIGCVFAFALVGAWIDSKT